MKLKTIKNKYSYTKVIIIYIILIENKQISNDQ